MSKKKNGRVAQDVSPATTSKRQTPAFITPMAALVVKDLPEGDEWIYELKLDGYRVLASKTQLLTRQKKDATALYP